MMYNVYESGSAVYDKSFDTLQEAFDYARENFSAWMIEEYRSWDDAVVILHS